MSDWWAIIATGPSLRRADADALRFCTGVAVNCGIFYAPWCEYLFAADNVWWKYYGPKVGWFRGRRISRNSRTPHIESWRGKNWPRTGGNSGHMAIQYAVDQGAKNVALLGFDQQKTGGMAHNHADHPKLADDGKRTNMANAGGVAAWPRLMAKTSLDLKERGIKVINLSRETALTCFPRMSVEKFVEDVCP